MKIAYLITAYNNPSHLQSLIKALDYKDVFFFIHIDKKSKYNFNIVKKDNIFVLKENLNVYWGGFSFIEAVLRLLNKAKQTGTFDYFILVSGADYPVRSNEYIKDFLKKNKEKEFINLAKMPENDKPFHRIDYYYLETGYDLSFSNLLKRTINRIVRILHIKRSLPKKYSDIVLYGGSNWWAFTNNFVLYLLDFIKKNDEFVNFFKHTLIPEESFFHTIIGNSLYKKNIINSFVFTEWADKHTGHPEEITSEHLALFKKNEIVSIYGSKKSTLLFARKFSDKNILLLKIIDKKFRT